VLVAAFGAAARTLATPWKKLPQGPPINFYEASLARTADGVLHVAYPRNGGSTGDVWHVRITGAGAVGAATPIAQGWAGVENPALLVAPDGTLRAFWGGIKSTDPANTNDALNTATAPADGSAWTLQPGRVSGDSSAYVSPTGAAVAKDGQFVEATTSTFGLRFHYGLTPASQTFQVPGNCCYYDPGIGVDSVSGQTVLGWYSNESQPPGEGVFLQEISPTGLVGPRRLAPGSTDGKNAVSPGYRTPVTGRIGAAGVYLAYGVGYPSFKRVALIRFGAPAPAIQIGAADNHGANLAAAPQGRLWLFWRRGANLFATRTNRAVTAIEPISVFGGPPGTDTIWTFAGNGSRGPLDLVANVQTSDAAFWYRRLLPRLSLHGSALGSRQARFVVTDAGEPVSGATVKVKGHAVHTNAGGVASVDGLPRGRATAVATKNGYQPASARVLVR